MAIIGWLFLAVITAGTCVTTLLIGWAMIAVKGRPDGEFWLFFAAACGLVYLSYRTFPFAVTVAA